MNIVYYIMFWLMVGTSVSAMIDFLAYLTNATSRLSNLERVILITFWPVGLVLFIYYFIIEIRKKK